MNTPRQLKLPIGDPDKQEGAVKPQGPARRPSVSTTPENRPLDKEQNTELMAQVVARDNVVKALEKLEKEKKHTASGVDGMTVGEVRPYLREHWPRIKDKLLKGDYQPQPVKRTEIPKERGGKRKLGIPTVLDRFIQLALLEVLTPIFEPTFSDRSYGFRPKRSQHQAVRQAQSDIQDKRWVVDTDISKFFDTVNHDRLMARLSRYIEDKRVLILIGRYLRAGVMINGVVMETYQGTPLSPLLSNIVLDELDKELERRGQSFVRYADDAQVYVGSKYAAKRVMESLIRFLEEKLKLKINQEKSAVDLAYRREYLSFSFYVARGGRIGIRLAEKALGKVKDRIRERTSRSSGVNIDSRIEALNQYLTGWLGYFSLADCRGHLERITEWVRRRLRMCYLKQWKRCRTRLRKLRGLGLDEDEVRKLAFSRKGNYLAC